MGRGAAARCRCPRLALVGDGGWRWSYAALNMVGGEFLPAVATGQSRRSIVRAFTRLVQRRAPIYDKGREGHYNLDVGAAQVRARLRS